MHKLEFSILILFCYQLVMGQNLSENSTGSFTFTPQEPLNRPLIEVFYHIPEGDITSMPILMSFHGADRDGANYRDFWINMANANGFMVFAPEFSSDNYPGLGDNYIMSNIFDDGDNPSPETYNDPTEWTCSVLDPLFEYVKSDFSGTQVAYSAWGHSAGAQFLHRLFMYLPNTKINVAICSNAGWYTVPENTVSYPYGLLHGQLLDSDLIHAFSNKLIVHLGEEDTIPSSAPGGPRDNPTVNDQQGLHRLERGQYFFNTSQSIAQNLSVLFNWEKHEVSGVGHDPQLMANDALQYLLPFLLSTDTANQNYFQLYPNPTNGRLIYITTPNEDIITFEIFNMLGEQLKKASVRPNTELDVSILKSGVYILKLEQKNCQITKK
jgi:hypothetical protein